MITYWKNYSIKSTHFDTKVIFTFPNFPLKTNHKLTLADWLYYGLTGIVM